jgi:hypothetical protein
LKENKHYGIFWRWCDGYLGRKKIIDKKWLELINISSKLSGFKTKVQNYLFSISNDEQVEIDIRHIMTCIMASKMTYLLIILIKYIQSNKFPRLLEKTQKRTK